MLYRWVLFGIFVFRHLCVFAQFAPAAGKPGSTAIKADSSCFTAWASSGDAELGLRILTEPDSGFVSVGSVASALGPALRNGVISLGDGGKITLYFETGIVNGAGFDFAVFENAFNDSFLELAHVEISANGLDFYRFPSISLSPSDLQTQAFGATYPENIHNLAGKYRMPYGTPFDISDLDSVYENLPSAYYYVRIIDAIGSIDTMKGSFDSKGNIINDPWPTPFASSGFDLDAVGVIHSAVANCIQNPDLSRWSICPLDHGIRISHTIKLENFRIYDLKGRLQYSFFAGEECLKHLDIIHLQSGMYVLYTLGNSQIIWVP